MNIKTILLAFAALLCIVGCEYDDTDIKNSIEQLNKRLSAVETVQNAYKNNLFIKTIKPITNGYEIIFTDGSTATITNGVDGNDGLNGTDGKDGINGTDGKDGDTLFKSITIGENEVTFILTDGSTFTIPLYNALSVTFDVGETLGAITNSTFKIGYTVESNIKNVSAEVITSADIKARIVDPNALNGTIEITTGDNIDKYSKIVVLVTNGEKLIMRSLSFEAPELILYNNSNKEIGCAGGKLDLEFISNVECEVIIPADAQDWLSCSQTRSSQYQCITLNVAANKGQNRNTTVKVQSLDGKLYIDYFIKQEGAIVVINSHEAIDLGLSVLWSTCNYGASSSSDLGGYYLWGDSTGTAIGSDYGDYSAPNLQSVCGTKYDIVYKKWGENWRLPTMAEFRELYSKCSRVNTTENGVSGVKFTGPNGNSIFLPYTGISFPASGPIGTYQVTWTDSAYYMTGESYSDSYGRFAYTFSFSSSQSYNLPSFNVDYIKMQIRGVAKK